MHTANYVHRFAQIVGRRHSRTPRQRWIYVAISQTLRRKRGDIDAERKNHDNKIKTAGSTITYDARWPPGNTVRSIRSDSYERWPPINAVLSLESASSEGFQIKLLESVQKLRKEIGWLRREVCNLKAFVINSNKWRAGAHWKNRHGSMIWKKCCRKDFRASRSRFTDWHLVR